MRFNPEVGSTTVIECRVLRNPNRIEPIAGATPYRGTVVSHRPGDRGFLARKTRRRRRMDVRDNQIAGCARDERRIDTLIVAVIRFGNLGSGIRERRLPVTAYVGANDYVAALHRRRDGKRLLDVIALSLVQSALVAEHA